MSNITMQGKTSFTCTCTHGGGGHAPGCDYFVPTKEQYLSVCAERDEARGIVKKAVAFLDAYDEAGGLAATQTEAEAFDNALDAAGVDNLGHKPGTNRPWWLTL